MENKKLEKRVKEEEEKLLKVQKTKKIPKKIKKPKLKKPSDISDKVKTKPKKEIKHDFNYQKFLENQNMKLDYVSMFSYMGSGVKENKYEYLSGETDAVKMAYKKDAILSWAEIKEFTEEWKMDSLSNINRNFETSERREAYKMWKITNPGAALFLYELCLT